MGKVSLPSARHGDIHQAGRPRCKVRQIPGHLRGELPLPDRQRRRPAEQGRGRFRQALEPQRLDLDLPVEAGDADLRERAKKATR